MSQSQTHVLIFGSSARAAAFSALRAGWTPWCADLFADADLARHCPVTRVKDNYPLGFLDLVGRDIPGPWIYTGGLENQPLLIGQMQDRRRLWGNGPATVARARAPETLAAAAEAVGLPAPALILRGRLPLSGSWLFKPRGGAGGVGIRLAVPGDTIPANCYAQEFLTGVPAAALYVAVNGRAIYLGLTRQLVGKSWLCAPPFRYCGSVGPVAVAAELSGQLRRLGAVLAHRADLAGIFGVDGLLADDSFHPVEVNPRYTASVEVLELATGISALDLHRRAFESTAALALTTPAGRSTVLGKAVVFAPAPAVFPDSGPWLETLQANPVEAVHEMPTFADIPNSGEPVERGQPILTVFAAGRDEAECERRLQRLAAEVLRCLYPGGEISPGEQP